MLWKFHKVAQPVFIEWQSTIYSSPPPPKILGQNAAIKVSLQEQPSKAKKSSQLVHGLAQKKSNIYVISFWIIFSASWFFWIGYFFQKRSLIGSILGSVCPFDICRILPFETFPISECAKELFGIRLSSREGFAFPAKSFWMWLHTEEKGSGACGLKIFKEASDLKRLWSWKRR